MFNSATRCIVTTFCFVLALSGQGWAQHEKSLELAQLSIEATMAGNRDLAIALALRAFPDKPTAADLENFPEAYGALLRAVAARITRADRSGFQHYAVNSKGDRAVAGPANGPQDGTQHAAPYALFDPRNNELIAELVTWDVPMSMVYGPGLPPAFSPDGNLVAIWAMDEGQALLFDTKDGKAHLPLDGGGQPGWIVGFSPDGTHLAAVAGGRLLVWDLSNRELVSGFWPNQLGNFDVAAWAADGSFVVARAETENYEISVVVLERYTQSGIEGTVRFDATGPSIYLLPAKVGSTMLVYVGDNQFVANPVQETATRLGGAVGSFAQIVRDGTVAATLVATGYDENYMPTGFELIASDFQGNRIETTSRDWIVFDQYPVGTDGTMLGMGSARPFTYVGHDVPSGTELYEMVWSGLSESQRQDIAANRVVR